MIVSVLQENLLSAISRTSRIVSPKPQLPIVQNVLLIAESGKLLAATTNLETTEIVRVGAKVEKEGGICVSAKLLAELVLSLPSETVHLSVENSALRVVCAGTKALLPGISAAEFPPVVNKKQQEKLLLKKKELTQALSDVLYAAATDEGRPLLAGVKIISSKDEIKLAATDGYRLSVKQVAMQTGGVFDFVVPARALGEVVKSAQEEKEEDEMTMGKTPDGQLVFTIGDTEVHTRVIDGEYPNFQKIIPTTHTTRATVEKDVLTRAVKSASIFARDSANIIKIQVGKNNLSVSANTPQVGENTVEIEAQTEGETAEIAFNSRFLLEFLSNFAQKEIVFDMTGSLNPGVFRASGDQSFLHVIMPVRVQA